MLKIRRIVIAIILISIILIVQTNAFAYSIDAKGGYKNNKYVSGNYTFITDYNYTMNFRTSLNFENDKTENKQTSEPYFPCKDPVVATTLAIFPGFIIHGLGHYYVGENNTGARLLSFELASVIVYFVANGRQLDGANIDERERTSKTLVNLSIVTFAVVWLYDIIGSPIKAVEANREYREWHSIYPEVRKDLVALNISLSF